MTDCKGLFGKWFGHKFEKYQIRGRFDPMYIYSTVNNEPNNLTRTIPIPCFEIRCKRCGVKPDEN